MVEKRGTQGILAHVIMILGVFIVAFPLYLAFVASTHTAQGQARRSFSSG